MLSPFITEYNYDFLPPAPQQQPRSISPLLFSTTMHNSSKHAADISRLLDPSYRSASTSKGYVSPQAYVDPYGDLHDPDYRDFPTLLPSSSSTSSKRSPRPHWELTLDNENALDEDSDELDEEDSFFLSTSTAAHPQNHSRYSARRSSHNSGSRIPRQSSFSTYATTYSSNYYSPSFTVSTLPTSYESDKTVLSRCSDTDEKKKKTKTRRLSKGDKERGKEREGLWGGSVPAAETYYRGSLDHSRDLPPTQEEVEDTRLGSPTTSTIIRSKELEYVPTCTQSLRRQWQALALRFRFSMFRAQRKVMRRVHTLGL